MESGRRCTGGVPLFHRHDAECGSSASERRLPQAPVRRRSRWRRAALLTGTGALFLAGMAMMRRSAATVAAHAGGEPILDLRFGVSAGEVGDYLERLGTAGRAAYSTQFHLIDSIYPVTYTLFYCCAIGVLGDIARVPPRPRRVLLSVPVAAMMLDYLENFLVAALLRTHPEPIGLVAGALPAVTIAKFVMAYAALGVVVWLVVRVPLRKRGPRFAP